MGKARRGLQAPVGRGRRLHYPVGLMLPVFIVAIFLGAGLLFLVQPLAARLMLPLAGGSPQVWNTAMVFFQGTLLLGYLYTHLLTRRATGRVQVGIHVVVMALAGLALPIALPTSMSVPAGDSVSWWVLGTLAMVVGGPFFAVATLGPLLQRWFASSGHSRGKDPYFLYAASNLGSAAGLLAYPLLLEPGLTLRGQGLAWGVLYVLLVVLVIVCALPTLRAGEPSGLAEPTKAEASEGLTWGRRGRWVLLAFVPSSLMLGSTQAITMDVAAVPMLWVIPLLLYLVSMSLAFASGVGVTGRTLARILPGAGLLVLGVMAAGVGTNLFLAMGAHLAFLFVGAWMCHRLLAESRPGVSRLTEFYLWVSVGGVCGGIFNAIIAPVAFPLLFEYPLVIGLALAMRPQSTEAMRTRLGRGLAMGWIVLLLLAVLVTRQFVAGHPDIYQGRLIVAAVCATLLGVAWLSRAGGGALSWGALAAGLVIVGGGRAGKVLETRRTYFGIHQVVEEKDGKWHRLLHGTTVHGLQPREPTLGRIPTAYYHPTGPLGEMFALLAARGTPLRVGAIGLGAGAVAAYARPGDEFTFYEIDRAVIEIATDPRYFTYVPDARGSVTIILGDGRLTIGARPDASLDLIVLDAFTSDAIPVHLLTKEAFEQAYLPKLARGGIIGVHISNRHLALGGVLARIAESVGCVAFGVNDDVTPELALQGKKDSTWVVITPEGTDLGEIASGGRWVRGRAAPGTPLWTDDYSNILSVMFPASNSP